MKLKYLHIKNYRSCRSIELEIGSLHALVGANNAGKSVILRALDFLFDPSATKIDSETFWNGDTSLTIWVEAIFDVLTTQEAEKLTGYLQEDGTFHMARSARVVRDPQLEQGADRKIEISQHYCILMPSPLWLRESEINGANIDKWWDDKDNLVANGHSFFEFVEQRKPAVGTWKTKASEFIKQYISPKDLEAVWKENPKGYAGVLKSILPNFIYVPAVRDVSDEAKFTKSSPFGKLLNSVVSNIAYTQKKIIDRSLKTILNKLNREGGDRRLDSITHTERRLNELVNDYMECEFEIEFQTPTIDTLLASPKLYANDGFRNVIENKGNGLQRAVIFSILRCYSELLSGNTDEKTRVNIFAIEEPEIYMHPLAQRTIRRVLLDISNSGDQVLFSTHSFLLLDVARFDEIIRVEATPCKEKRCKTIESKVWQLPMYKMILDIENRIPKLKGKVTDQSIRELYSHAYHPTRSEGFFAKKIILVEGATEQYCLPIYAEAMGYSFDKMNISIVDCGGKGPMDRLYRIFNELGIPCFMLFDYDMGNTDGEVINKSKELLSMLGENPAPSIEKAFISDCIAYFTHKWETDLADEISGIEAFADEARNLLGLKSESGKPLIARYIAKRITESNPPIVPRTIQMIVEKAIKVTWQKSCLVTDTRTHV